jgi:hypothetical protein
VVQGSLIGRIFILGWQGGAWEEYWCLYFSFGMILYLEIYVVYKEVASLKEAYYMKLSLFQGVEYLF